MDDTLSTALFVLGCPRLCRICISPGSTWPRSTAHSSCWAVLKACSVQPRREAMPPAVRCPHTGDTQPAHDRPQWEVADIFRLYSDTYRQTQGVSAAQHKVIDAIIACRTAQLGGHAE